MIIEIYKESRMSDGHVKKFSSLYWFKSKKKNKNMLSLFRFIYYCVEAAHETVVGNLLLSCIYNKKDY